jgi:hypothetical protein
MEKQDCHKYTNGWKNYSFDEGRRDSGLRYTPLKKGLEGAPLDSFLSGSL